jgi:hypothetical protein
MQLSNSLLDNFSLRPGIGKRAHAFEIAGEKTALPLARRAWCWPLPSSWQSSGVERVTNERTTASGVQFSKLCNGNGAINRHRFAQRFDAFNLVHGLRRKIRFATMRA